MNNNQDVNMSESMYFNNQLDVNQIPRIRVIVRKRPLNKKELSKGEQDVIDNVNNTVIVKELKVKVDLTKYIEEHHFNFDMTFDEKSSNQDIYLQIVRPMIESAFKKIKITCFAYGQTGSGKTFTMMGNGSCQSDNSIPGLYLFSAFDIFNLLERQEYSHLEIWVSFYEIYCGKLFDLLNDRNSLTAREDGKQNIVIVGLTERQVINLDQLMNIIEYGLKARSVGSTGANADSSRSHGILQICLKDPNGDNHGKITFIDLAGSERAADTVGTDKQTKFDGAEINKSLLALKECIRALDQEKKHLPFRGSKLTMVLRDSFIGNCKTLMIANISPCSSSTEHTLNTLRYADRVKELKKEVENGNNNNNACYDPQELINNQMMMPRQHNKTIKYNVQEKKQTSVKIPASNYMNLSSNQMHPKKNNMVNNLGNMLNQGSNSFNNAVVNNNNLLQKQSSYNSTFSNNNFQTNNNNRQNVNLPQNNSNINKSAGLSNYSNNNPYEKENNNFQNLPNNNNIMMKSTFNNSNNQKLGTRNTIDNSAFNNNNKNNYLNNKLNNTLNNITNVNSNTMNTSINMQIESNTDNTSVYSNNNKIPNNTSINNTFPLNASINKNNLNQTNSFINYNYNNNNTIPNSFAFNTQNNTPDPNNFSTSNQKNMNNANNNISASQNLNNPNMNMSMNNHPNNNNNLSFEINNNQQQFNFFNQPSCQNPNNYNNSINNNNFNNSNMNNHENVIPNNNSVANASNLIKGLTTNNSNNQQNNQLSLNIGLNNLKNRSKQEYEENDIKALREKQEDIRQKIYFEENSHKFRIKSHLEEMLNLFEQQSYIIENTGSNVKLVDINSLDEIFVKQIEKTSFMRGCISSLRNLFLEEEKIDNKIRLIMGNNANTSVTNEQNQSNYETQSNLSYYDNVNIVTNNIACENDIESNNLNALQMQS